MRTPPRQQARAGREAGVLAAAAAARLPLRFFPLPLAIGGVPAAMQEAALQSLAEEDCGRPGRFAAGRFSDRAHPVQPTKFYRFSRRPERRAIDFRFIEFFVNCSQDLEVSLGKDPIKKALSYKKIGAMGFGFVPQASIEASGL